MAIETDQPRVNLDQLCINTIRTLAMDAVEQARSGHPGAPMGGAAMAYVLWTRHLRHNPRNPNWPDRDRFILSNGHASMLLYALLYLTGYDLSLDDLRAFRQWGSRTPGHPEAGHTPGVEVTTGPLGQGFGNGVGMALAERILAARYNRPGHTVVDHYTYGIVSDGDLMEGITHEAAALAGHLGLGRLIYLYDDNHISIEGPTQLAMSEDVAARFVAYGWHVQRVEDGNSLEELDRALHEARRVQDRPSLILVRTHIGYGSPRKQDTAAAHGEPLGQEEVRRTKEVYGWPPEPPFFVPEEALAHFRQATVRGEALEADWRRRFEAYARAYPELAAELTAAWEGRLPEGWDRDLPRFVPGGKAVATRAASGTVLNALARRLPQLIGGSADLAPSTKTWIEGEESVQRGAYGGRNLHFGVREHGMGAALNGMARHGGLIPYGGTFLVFSDYMRPSIRLAALMKAHVIYVFTHDSIGVGEDGPTHQPVEHLAALRAIPGLVVIRPADANETAAAWAVAVRETRPVALILSRQNLPVLELPPGPSVERGGYVLADAPQGSEPDLILIATGSEVHLALGARQTLAEEGIQARVVSLPSWELFAEQPPEYQEAVLPPRVKARLAIEAGVALGWERFVGPWGGVLALDRFGASAPGGVVMERLGFSVANVVRRARGVLERVAR